MSWVNVAVTGMNAWGQMQSGKFADKQAQLMADQSDYAARVEEQNALKTAEIIRRAGRRQVGSANAAYAAAGVQVGQGSALETERQINLDVENDAFQALLEGGRRARGLRVDGVMQRTNGQMQKAAGYVNAESTVMQGYGSYMRQTGGWRTARVSQADLDAGNASNDPIGELNKRKGWT